jgi:hypothetical protein
VMGDHGRMDRRHSGQEAATALFSQHGHHDHARIFQKGSDD